MGDIVTIRPGAMGADFVSLTDERQRWLLDNDIQFVLRYVVPAEWTKIGKDYRAWETDWYHEHGIAVLPNFERFHNDATRYPDDWRQGVAHGHRFVELCAVFGFPPEVPHFVSIDQDIVRANIAEAERYARGFHSVLAAHDRLLGIYGDDDIAYRLRDLDPVFWRANAQAWDGESREVPVHIQQALPNDLGIDPNTCRAPFNAWLPTPAPSTPTPPEVPDMTGSTARLWRQRGTREVWLLGVGAPYNVPRELLDTYRAQGMDVVESDYRPLYEDCLRQVGRL